MIQGEFWHVTNAEQRANLVRAVKAHPLPFVCQLREETRSLGQNDMHAGLCRDIAKALKERTGLGYDVDYIRAKTKRKFGVVAYQVDPETGKEEPYLLSTTVYGKHQMSVLIEGTLAWAQSELGIALPDPRMKPEAKRA